MAGCVRYTLGLSSCCFLGCIVLGGFFILIFVLKVRLSTVNQAEENWWWE